jgi:hypothetical protein
MRAIAVVLAALGWSTSAAAADIPCGPVEKGVIHVDGLLDDWNDVSGIDIGGRDRDFSFTVKCNYDEKTLYLAIDVRDDYFARTRESKAGEDHLEIAFVDQGKVEKLVVYPADDAAKAPRKVHWSSGHAMKGVEVADAKQAAGWGVEARLALASVPGWSVGVPSIKLGVAAYDCDSKASSKTEATLESSPIASVAAMGVVEFPEANATLDAFLRDRKLSSKDVLFDKMARVGPGATLRMVVAGGYIAAIGDEYSYVTLPFRDKKDLKEVRLVDLGGDGHDAAVIRYVERGGGGVREVLAAYRTTSEGLRRTFGCEVAKSQGANRLDTKVSFLKKGRATEILIEPLPPVGWTELTYRESPAADLVPIPTPWGTEKRARFQFKGENYVRAE